MRKFTVVLALLCVTTICVNAQTEISGPWSTEVFPTLTINLKASGNMLTGSIDRGQQRLAEIYDGKIEGSVITFKLNSPDGDRTITFTGSLIGEEIAFMRSVEVRPGGNLGGPGIFGSAGPHTFTVRRATDDGLSAASTTQTDQTADPNFEATVSNPTFTDIHPTVLFDDGHFNFHTSTGRYKPFVDLLTNDGYIITSNTARFDQAILSKYQILIISNAQGAENTMDPKAAEAAFTEPECDAVQNWVHSGGALLLIADHVPHGGAASGLARRFGIEMSNGVTTDESNYERSRNTGSLIFSQDNKLLGDHPILRGRNEAERINRVTTFVGQSLKGPEPSTPLLKLADTAKDLLSDQTSVSAAGRTQAIALEAGKGRVVAFGEAAALTAQLSARGKSGMSFPGSDNRQLVLNILHWLSGVLD
jgi:hypothetical protein